MTISGECKLRRSDLRNRLSEIVYSCVVSQCDPASFFTSHFSLLSVSGTRDLHRHPGQNGNRFTFQGSDRQSMQDLSNGIEKGHRFSLDIFVLFYILLAFVIMYCSLRGNIIRSFKSL